MQPPHSTDLTVAAVVRHAGRYLMVEEVATGEVVLNQPGGHIESGESPEAAAAREVLEETGCTVSIGALIGVYLWIHPDSGQQFLRIVYVADYVDCDEARELDTGIVRRRWMTRAEIEQRHDLRTPGVLRCIRDFEAGRRDADGLVPGALSLDVDAVIARADLV